MKNAQVTVKKPKSRPRLNRTNRKSWLKTKPLNKRKSPVAGKELKAAIMQMINQHKIRDTDGEISYQFIDDSKIKKVYINQQIYNALVAGSLVIARENESYAFLPKALADRINSKMEGFIIVNNSEKNEETTDEEDPYAAYVIPDDLMW